MGDTICWTCKNACGGCSWSQFKVQKPVKGWKAKRTRINTGTPERPRMIKSYLVISCPEYEKDREET